MESVNGTSERREWKLRSELPVSSSDFDSHLDGLQKETGLSRATLRVCLQRGLDQARTILEFLNPRIDALADPFFLKDMDRAVDRLIQAREKHESVRIFADYDVDGTTGAALLSWFFKDCSIRCDVRQPDRFRDGYGLHVRAVEEAQAAGTQLLVSVDCGITSHEAARRARELGLDLVVLDHHQLDQYGVPDACAVVDAHRPDCRSGLTQLCGCGVAFYLARALRAKGRERGWWSPGTEPNLKQHLDLAVMATAADLVPLTGDNRAIVKHGLEVLRHSKKPGVRALLDVAGLDAASGREITPTHLGFVLGPRINASGRMGSAELALELLTTTDAAKAAQLAAELERMNQDRSLVQNRIWDEVRARVDEGLSKGLYRHSVVVADPGWHEGVVGIVASKVVETYRKPAVVIALRDDFGKGSARSWGGKDVLQALRMSQSYLLGFGGHKHAAGLSVAHENVEHFAAAFDEALSQLPDDPSLRPLLIEGVFAVEELDVKTLQEIERLGPYGIGNPEPIFAIRASVRNHQLLKGKHLKLHLAESAQSRAQLEAIWFNGAERQVEVLAQSSQQLAEWAGVPELNRFRGRVTPTLRVKDWRSLSAE